MSRALALIFACLASSSCSSIRSAAFAETYDGFLIHFTEGFVFYPCGGHPKLGWRVANEAAILPSLQSFPGQSLGIGNLVYMSCTGVRRPISNPTPELPVLPYDIRIERVLEIRNSRPNDCHAKRPNHAMERTAGSLTLNF